MNRRVVACVFAVLVESSTVAVAAAIGGGDGEATRWSMQADAMAVGDFGVQEEGIFLVGPLEDNLALAGCAAGDCHDKARVMQHHVVYKAMRCGSKTKCVLQLSFYLYRQHYSN